jgi:hypothetical protein
MEPTGADWLPLPALQQVCWATLGGRQVLTLKAWLANDDNEKRKTATAQQAALLNLSLVRSRGVQCIPVKLKYLSGAVPKQLEGACCRSAIAGVRLCRA